MKQKLTHARRSLLRVAAFMAAGPVLASFGATLAQAAPPPVTILNVS
jgi:hypothetical protein